MEANPCASKVVPITSCLFHYATGTMNIMIFDKPAKKLVGVSAEELIEDTTGEQISAVISSHHQSRALLVGPHRGGFMVMDVLNDDELQVSSSVKME